MYKAKSTKIYGRVKNTDKKRASCSINNKQLGFSLSLSSKVSADSIKFKISCGNAANVGCRNYRLTN